uniref:Uncharacterized protein n=1 Tax=Megaselia scalaris TaxID=36166 RepID=T1GZW5_MEGSC
MPSLDEMENHFMNIFSKDSQQDEEPIQDRRQEQITSNPVEERE